ncbi:MAG: phosphoribosylanthranilate isomerase [Chthonomonadetes bacterium]|nr:phosphoribosylanthranilate isomerase [Chthonomonadetes bacterium]
MIRVKICGLTCEEDIHIAVRYGAHAVGFVFEPSSPRYIGDRADVLELLRCVPPFVVRVAVFGSLRDLPAEMWHEVDAVQFVSGEAIALPLHLRRIRAVRLRTEEDVRHALRLQDEADALLVDAYHPQKMGGTGETANWRLARLLRDEATKPVILAGGLTPDNVCDAIAQVQPFAVDVSSGVESAPGKKDHLKVKEFIANVRRFADGS